MKINPFILSQVKEKQNELIMTTESIDKIEVSNVVYSFYDAMSDKETFFRCVKTKEYIIAALYWKTNIPEISSGRTGLYVVIGFLLTDYEGNYDGFLSYSMNFFRTLENQFGVSMQKKDADELFEMIQQDVTDTLQKLEAACKKLKHGIYGISLRKSFKREIMKDKRITGKKIYLYMLNDVPDFYADWTAFMDEAFFLISEYGYGDVSSLEAYTMCSIRILQNGWKMPIHDINEAQMARYKDYRYLVIA